MGYARNGSYGVHGLQGVASLVATGEYVFAVGDDTIRVWGTGDLSTTTIVAADGDDTIRVAGDALEAPVTVDGGDPSTSPGDTLLFDAGGEPVTPRPDRSPATVALWSRAGT